VNILILLLVLFAGMSGTHVTLAMWGKLLGPLMKKQAAERRKAAKKKAEQKKAGRKKATARQLLAHKDVVKREFDGVGYNPELISDAMAGITYEGWHQEHFIDQCSSSVDASSREALARAALVEADAKADKITAQLELQYDSGTASSTEDPPPTGHSN
jgi:hypothetical protein